MKGIRDGAQANCMSKSASSDSTSLVLDVDDFKGDFSFDDLFGNLVTELLPSYLEKEVDSSEGHDALSNGHLRVPSNAGKLLSSPLFPEVDALLSLFKNSSTQLVEQKRQVDAKLSNLTQEVSVQDLKHRKTLAELEKGVDGLFGSFARLDSRISSVGHTAAKIGDHLQDHLLMKILEDRKQLSPLLLEMQLQIKGWKLLSQTSRSTAMFNRGTSAMQHYVGLRPMFDVEVMNADAKLVLGDEGAQPSPNNVANGLSSMFKEIADTVRKEAATIAAVFPSPKDVMSILVQRVLEDRVPKLLEKLLQKPSLVNPPPMEEGGLVLYLRLLAVAYEKTQEFAKDLRSVGCGDLDVEGVEEIKRRKKEEQRVQQKWKGNTDS